MEQRKAKCSRYGMFTGILYIGILGLVFGAVLAVPFKPETWTCSDVASVLATGIALAYVLLGAGDWLLQRLALALVGQRPLQVPGRLARHVQRRDAEAHAEEDKKAHELADARNQADSAAHMAKKSLAEHGDKLDAAEKEAIEKAIKDVEEILRDGDKDAITAKTEALTNAVMKVGEKLYAQ